MPRDGHTDDIGEAVRAARNASRGMDGPAPLLDPAAPLASARRYIATAHDHCGTRTLHHQNGSFFAWAESHYVERAPEEMRSHLYAYLDHATRLTREGDAVPFNPNKAKVANVLEALAAEAQLDQSVRAPTWLAGDGLDPREIIACANGLLHLPTGRLDPHSPAFFTLNALDFAYTPEAPEPAAWLAFLDDVWPDDAEAIACLQEVFGLALTGDTSHQKMVLVVGPKRSGKGTIGRVLTRLVGAANVVGPTLGSLASNFGLGPLIGKRLAIVSDARLSGKADQQIIVERLLAISGEDSLTIDRKYRDGWTGKLDTRFVLLTNELPKLTDNSGALASRFVTLVMTQSFYGREDHGLIDRLLLEMPGILNWAIAGWRRLQARGHFLPPASSEAAQQDLEDLGSPISAFLRECCETGAGREIRATELYQAWCEWCADQGRSHPGTAQSFGRDLNAAVPGLSIFQPKAEPGQQRFRFYQGIAFTSEFAAQGRKAPTQAEQPGPAYFNGDPGYVAT